MDTLVIVPGIMGSDLWLDEERIWPPRIGNLMKVKDPDRLLSPDVATRDVIRGIMIFGFYEELLEPLARWGYREGTPQPGDRGKIVVHPYNWVRGIPETAQDLSGKLATLANEDPDASLVLLAHSMGGLVCTYALECLAHGDLDWRRKVRLFVTFGTPFYGAPEALLNAFGVEGTTGIAAADCQRLMADPRFPSAYQLFPHLVAKADWDAASPLAPVEDYKSLDLLVTLGPENLAKAEALQEALANAVANEGTRKFNFCGARHTTVWAMARAPYEGASIVPHEAPSGDGTVPSWSGRQDIHVQFAPLGAKHRATFRDPALLKILEQLLIEGKSPGGPNGPDGPTMKPPRPGPSPQPSVSLTSNAVSSLRDTVEVEVAEPPVGDTLHLQWIPVADVETRDDLARHLSDLKWTAIGAETSIALGAELEYPQRLMLRRPDAPGLYALTTWAGEARRFVGALDSTRMDLLWVFQDAHLGKTGDDTPQESPLVVDDAMELASARDDANADAFAESRATHRELHHSDG